MEAALQALRAQLVAAIAQVDAMLGSEPEPEETGGPCCPKCKGTDLQLLPGTFGAEAFRICGCGWIEGQEEP